MNRSVQILEEATGFRSRAGKGRGLILGLGLFAAGCGSPPLPPLLPAPTITATPNPACGFTPLGSIGCKASNQLTVIGSAADWLAYQALPGCGTSVPGALAGFDFSSTMVLDYDHYDCSSHTLSCGVEITDVCIFWDRIEVHVSQKCGDAFFPNPGLALQVCSGSAVSIPQSSLPVSVVLCSQMGRLAPGVSPCP